MFPRWDIILLNVDLLLLNMPALKVDDEMKLGFYRKWFYLFISLFLLESCIALFVHDGFIRPFVGDVLVVWLVFAFVRMFYAGGENWQVAAGVFAFAILVEAGQYFDLVSLLGLQDSPIARVLIGSVFDWKDILAYGLGVGILVVVLRTDRITEIKK